MVTAEAATDYCPACGAQLDPILGGYRLNVATFDVTLDCIGTEEEDGRAISFTILCDGDLALNEMKGTHPSIAGP